ncbi:hypothetical protein ACS0TY_001793 [Phlomoides rotata]
MVQRFSSFTCLYTHRRTIVLASKNLRLECCKILCRFLNFFLPKQLIYEKLPNDICERHVLLLDPVLATGNSANQAIELLIQKGVPEAHIIFLNLISIGKDVTLEKLLTCLLQLYLEIGKDVTLEKLLAYLL